jgi:hypothetical protein
VPHDADSKAGHTEKAEDGISKQLISLALPLLSFHWSLLPTLKSGVERDKDAYIRAISNFASFQVQALGMVLDPNRRLRGQSGDHSFEKKLQDEITNVLELSVARMISLVEVQEIILPRMIKRLNDIRNEKTPAEQANPPEHPEESERREPT